MHHFHDFTVYSPWNDIQLPPQGLSCFWRHFDKRDLTFLLTKNFECFPGNIFGYVFFFSVFGFNSKDSGYFFELVHVLDGIP